MKKTLCLCALFFLWTLGQEIQAQEGFPPQERLPWAGGAPSTELFKLLQELNREYGPDTVTLISWLLDSAVRSGSVLTSSAKVNGDELHQEKKFLVFQVDTGIIFNTRKMDQNGRLTTLWEKILARTFARLETLQVPADGVLIRLLYHSKSFPETESLAEQVDEPGAVEEAKFYFLNEQMRAFLSKELSPQGLLTRSQVLVNGSPVTFILPDGAQHTGIIASGHAAEPS